MPHADDGTLHAYLDGELPPAEARGVEAHVAECPGCRARLEEERALIARAHELLGLASPPDRAIPPFRAGDLKPPVRPWSRMRLPLAWAATVVLALGIGMYLGGGSAVPGREQPVAQRAAEVAPPAPLAALPADSAGTARVEPGRPRRTRPIQPPPSTDVAAAERKQEEGARPADAARLDRVARLPARETDSAAAGLGALAASKAAPPAAPPAQAYAALPLSIDSARVLLGQDPVALPDAPIRSMRREPAIGEAIVVLEQALDSSTVIELRERRPAALGLEAVVVTGAAEAGARHDSLETRRRPGLTPRPTTRLADSLAAVSRAEGRIIQEQDRPVLHVGNLRVEISGPLTADSLKKLLERLKPIR